MFALHVGQGDGFLLVPQRRKLRDLSRFGDVKGAKESTDLKASTNSKWILELRRDLCDRSSNPLSPPFGLLLPVRVTSPSPFSASPIDPQATDPSTHFD